MLLQVIVKVEGGSAQKANQIQQQSLFLLKKEGSNLIAPFVRRPCKLVWWMLR